MNHLPHQHRAPGIVCGALLCVPAYSFGNPVSRLVTSATGTEKLFLFLALPATLLFLIMAIMTFAGIGADDGDIGDDGGGSGDTFSDSFHVFTIRNFIVFFMMFGWSGLAMLRSEATAFLSVLVAAGIGVIMILIVSYLFFIVAKLTHSGTIPTKSAVGRDGVVYLSIPAKRSGTGKVNVVVNGSKMELKAMTAGDAIATGEQVTVKDLVGDDVVLVEKS